MLSSTDAKEKRSIVAVLGGLAGLLAVSAAVMGPLCAQFGLDSRVASLVFFIGVIPGMLLALSLGALGLFRTRHGRSGRRAAGAGFSAGLALLLFGLSFRPWTLWATLHDATTSIDDPPLFSVAVRERRARSGQKRGLPRVNTTAYPSPSPDHPPPISGEQVVAYQRRYYPDLAPLVLPNVRTTEALLASREVARELGWTITAFEPEAGILEAVDVTTFFRFEDDVVVRVRPSGDGSVVDMRSLSLYRANDLGANAKRIRAFQARLSDRAGLK